MIHYLLYTVVITFVVVLCFFFGSMDSFKEEYSKFLISAVESDMFEMIKENKENYKDIIKAFISVNTIPLIFFPKLRREVVEGSLHYAIRKTEWKLKVML